MKALKTEGISIPQDISLIGVDEVPSYVAVDYKLAVIKIDHINRANMVMHLLQKEITEGMSVKFMVMSDCSLIEGESVKK